MINIAGSIGATDSCRINYFTQIGARFLNPDCSLFFYKNKKGTYLNWDLTRGM